MLEIDPRQTSPRSAGRQLPHLPNNEDLRAFTEKLGSVVSLGHWQHGDCCDAIVANGSIGWILSGIVRKCVIYESGQRRIVDVLMPGDFLGMRPDDARLFSFEALTDETLTGRIARGDFNALAEPDHRSTSSFMSEPARPSPGSKIIFWCRAVQGRRRRSRAIFI